MPRRRESARASAATSARWSHVRRSWLLGNTRFRLGCNREWDFFFWINAPRSQRYAWACQAWCDDSLRCQAITAGSTSQVESGVRSFVTAWTKVAFIDTDMMEKGWSLLEFLLQKEAKRPKTYVWFCWMQNAMFVYPANSCRCSADMNYNRINPNNQRQTELRCHVTAYSSFSSTCGVTWGCFSRGLICASVIVGASDLWILFIDGTSQSFGTECFFNISNIIFQTKWTFLGPLIFLDHIKAFWTYSCEIIVRLYLLRSANHPQLPSRNLTIKKNRRKQEFSF